jgi:hypothetical protein
MDSKMVEEAYVSFETAKLLKEKGFNEKCLMAYIDGYDSDFPSVYELENIGNDVVDAPTQQMAMRWLREIHNIKVNIFYNNPNYAIEYFELNTQTGVDESVFIGDGYDVYEEAAEIAIKYCLENLI